MVAQGEADFAVLDVISWKLMQRYDDFTQELTLVDLTSPTPALPFISARYQDTIRIQKALHNAVQNLTLGQREELLLQGLVALSQSFYQAVPNPPQP